MFGAALTGLPHPTCLPASQGHTVGVLNTGQAFNAEGLDRHALPAHLPPALASSPFNWVRPHLPRRCLLSGLARKRMQQSRWPPCSALGGDLGAAPRGGFAPSAAHARLLAPLQTRWSICCPCAHSLPRQVTLDVHAMLALPPPRAAAACWAAAYLQLAPKYSPAGVPACHVAAGQHAPACANRTPVLELAVACMCPTPATARAPPS